MLDDRDTLRLIEGHLEGTLSAEEEILFEKLRRTNPQLAVDLQFQQKFVNSMNRVGDELFLTKLQNLEQEIQTERAAKNKTANPLKELKDKVLQKGGELLDDLAAAFLPVPQYESFLTAISRGTFLKVISPKNGFDCQNDLLQFELKEGIPQALQLSIEDNRQTILMEQIIEKQTTRFEVDVEKLKAGRYYWKLKTVDEVVMGSFFRKKDLME